jgi:hypothetical protein
VFPSMGTTSWKVNCSRSPSSLTDSTLRNLFTHLITSSCSQIGDSRSFNWAPISAPNASSLRNGSPSYTASISGMIPDSCRVESLQMHGLYAHVQREAFCPIHLGVEWHIRFLLRACGNFYLNVYKKNLLIMVRNPQDGMKIVWLESC